ncbi:MULTISPECIES: disulfide bond formation protein B [unclassified Variovorax]|uniref:disulfide bond formation protein B n=1 Tax=unclassified Variovorax TaxID=663243 RepID=UPI0008399EAD|nr:Disulfide bond formation protein B [Variovorax sp. B2]PNG50864.1 Disulfide bond formation protein B [Variovorax sp. B4]VTU41649.1 disulfide bond formation protein B [Variovorax sp. PBL-H6]VTU44650.1 disulfide bond formation protein B [Variovorax sp. SRS16]VTU44698.1 disulfide bond formation protein B [Variovorax sp. PBL-E5]VTV18102.1 Disulfide bond formation protein B [Variovorax sp. WDL1]
MRFLRTNRFPLGVLAVSLGALALALVLQYGFSMAPCPLCVLQRLALVATALVGAAQMALQKRFTTPLTWLGFAASLGGFTLATWHIFKMVAAPTEDAACGPGLATWVDSLWTAELLPSVFAPMGDCFQDAANLLGLPLPVYACGLFLTVAALFRLNAINATSTLNS